MHGEIRRSRLINVAGALAMVLVGSGVPAVVDIGSLPPLAVSLPLTAVLLEVIRRSGLRPRITWDGSGLKVVYALGATSVTWEHVYFVRERGNQLEIGLEDRSIVWEFDHAWFLARLSRRYRSRAGENEKRLTAALEESRTSATAKTRERHIDQSFLVFLLLPLAIPLTLWLKAASLS
ncbi:hypothetical protein [Amycolatopsis sp. NPDC051128]|uniref:hypothetical protein n=1 Tax=Amycolatopsis sp. NPDC051128 TaxID=3155412 RepID=UPI003424BEAD